MITKDDLEKIGIIHMDYKLFPKRFHVPRIGEVDLHEPYNMDVIFQKIWDDGYNAGTRNGQNDKINEIKQALNIDV